MAKKIINARPDKKPSMAPFTNELSSSTRQKEKETSTQGQQKHEQAVD